MPELKKYFDRSRISVQRVVGYHKVPKETKLLTDEEAVEFAVEHGYDRSRCYCRVARRCCHRLV